MPVLQPKVSESLTLALLGRVREMRARGEDVASLAAGEPDFQTPDFVMEAAYKSMRAGNTKYVASQGIPSLREAIAHDYRERMKAPWVTADHVVVTGGAKQGIHVALSAAVGLGDEVLVPKPYWVSYPSLVKAVGGVVKSFGTQERNGFFPTVDELEAQYTPRTKALIFSSPGNPSGKMISRELLKEIMAWCARRRVQLIYDEIYERLVLGNQAHVCPLALTATESEDVFAVNAFSKSLSMTGWRLGFVVGHRESVKALTALQTQFITCMPGFIQEAVAETHGKIDAFLKPVVELYKRRMKLTLDALKRHVPEAHGIVPDGAFYVMTDLSKVIARKGFGSDKELCERLLNEKKTVIIPGESMGMPGWVRLSFATEEAEILKAIERLGEFCA